MLRGLGVTLTSPQTLKCTDIYRTPFLAFPRDRCLISQVGGLVLLCANSGLRLSGLAVNLSNGLWVCHSLLPQNKQEDDMESGEDSVTHKRHNRSLMGSFSKRKVIH